MAKSGLKHIDVGPELTKTEWESEESHELIHGTSFPSSPVERQLFYRDDEHKWYIYNGSAWVWLGGGGGGTEVHGNALINGCAVVSQRAADYTLVKNTYGIRADRWYGMATGTLVSAGVLTKTTAANCGKTGHAFKFSGVTLTGTGIIYFRYRMEAKDAIQFKNQTASFRCKVYQDTGGAINYTVYVRKANAADNFSAVTAISDSGAISVPNTTETTLSYLAIAMGDCSNGIEIEIKVECGAIATKNFEFTECQFELGSVATPFEFRPYGEELALCQRYYLKMAYGQYLPPRIRSYGSAGAYAGASYTFPTEMRITPTTTKNGTWTVSNCGQPSFGSVYSLGFFLEAQVTALGDIAFWPADATCSLEFNAEL